MPDAASVLQDITAVAPSADVLPGLPTSGMTPREVSRLLRMSPDRIRALIAAGELGAIDTARRRCGKPRFIILPQHLAEFIRRRAAAPPPKPLVRRRRVREVDYFPD